MRYEVTSTMANERLFPTLSLGSQKSDFEPLTISEISERFGLTLRALRFYEQRGLLDPIRRSGARYYDGAQQLRVQMILKGRQLGFTLLEIAGMLATPSGSSDQAAEFLLDEKTALAQLRLLEARQAEIEQGIAELRTTLRQFAATRKGRGNFSPAPDQCRERRGAAADVGIRTKIRKRRRDDIPKVQTAVRTDDGSPVPN